jgi:TRAP-type C4-dicarboxylate transport system substrate-binding protein
VACGLLFDVPYCFREDGRMMKLLKRQLLVKLLKKLEFEEI